MSISQHSPCSCILPRVLALIDQYLLFRVWAALLVQPWICSWMKGIARLQLPWLIFQPSTADGECWRWVGRGFLTRSVTACRASLKCLFSESKTSPRMRCCFAGDVIGRKQTVKNRVLLHKTCLWSETIQNTIITKQKS